MRQHDAAGVSIPEPRMEEEKEGWNVVVDDASLTPRTRAVSGAELVPNERLGFNKEDQPIVFSGELEQAVEAVVHMEQRQVLLFDAPDPSTALPAELDVDHGLFVPAPAASENPMLSVESWIGRQHEFEGPPLPEGWIRIRGAADRVLFFSLTTGVATTDLNLVLSTAGIVNDAPLDFVPPPAHPAPPLPPPEESPREGGNPQEPEVVKAKKAGAQKNKHCHVRVLGPNEDRASVPIVDEKQWWYRQNEFEHLPRLPEGWLYVKLNEDDEKVHYYWMATKEVGLLAPWEMGFG